MNKLVQFKIPELLCPAGSLDKLKVAVKYGADACYLAGQSFGLRSAADNFTYQELKAAVEFSHQHNSKVHVVLNSFFHDQDFYQLDEFLAYLEAIKVDAVIVSDLGVIKRVLSRTQIPVHLSTQASCLNVEAGLKWRDMGVHRLILGREVSLDEAHKIKNATELEIELFIHGSMCMAYSGNCTISNFTKGRDSNRGGCAHSCRFEYSLEDIQDKSRQHKAFFMSSKDLQGIRLIDEYIQAGIDSVKIEGRMKSQLYVGTVAKVYREALDYYQASGHFFHDRLHYWQNELAKVTNRDQTEASLLSKADKSSIFNEREIIDQPFQVAGYVKESIQGEHTLLEVRAAFTTQHNFELVPFEGDNYQFKLDEIYNIKGELVEKTKPSTLVKLPYIPGSQKYNIVRAKL